MSKAQLPQISPARVPQSVIAKLDELLLRVKPLGHPRATKEDIIGALIESASPWDTAAALSDYNPKLGQALLDLEAATSDG